MRKSSAGKSFPCQLLAAFNELHLINNELGLFLLAGHGDDPHRFRPLFSRAPQFFRAAVAVVADHAVGCVENRIGAPVVLLKSDDGGIREESLEVKNVGDFRTAKPIDRPN